MYRTTKKFARHPPGFALRHEFVTYVHLCVLVIGGGLDNGLRAFRGVVAFEDPRPDEHACTRTQWRIFATHEKRILVAESRQRKYEDQRRGGTLGVAGGKPAHAATKNKVSG